ncbi:hypothetical protein R1flu_003740 [Riccia fluitans]|uniref:Uncharacterized protein n=1 Tax=Riccia fluitans TaxID=41844 RepID=A0ABD1Y9Z3_9MARC
MLRWLLDSHSGDLQELEAAGSLTFFTVKADQTTILLEKERSQEFSSSLFPEGRIQTGDQTCKEWRPDKQETAEQLAQCLQHRIARTFR